jgi:hypothetical protein
MQSINNPYFNKNLQYIKINNHKFLLINKIILELDFYILFNLNPNYKFNYILCNIYSNKIIILSNNYYIDAKNKLLYKKNNNLSYDVIFTNSKYNNPFNGTLVNSNELINIYNNN